MSQGEKRFLAMKANTKADWTVSDIEVVCCCYGVTVNAATRGSHYKLSHPDIRTILTIPYKRPIKRAYIELFVAYIETVI